MAKIPEHTDKLGRPIIKGQCVAFSRHNELKIGVVAKVCPVMILVTEIPNQPEHSTYRKYAADLININGPEVTMYCLMHSN